MRKQLIRKKLRMEGYDYSEDGYYFVTICTKNKQEFFGNVINGKMILNECGKIADKVLNNLHFHYKNFFLDEYIIMPNHFHGIFVLCSDSKMLNELNSDTLVVNGFNPDTMAVNGFNPDTMAVNGFNPFTTTNNSFNTENQFITENPVITNNSFNTEKKHGLSQIVGSFKAFTSREIHKQFNNYEFAWQKSFYDTVIRNEKELLKNREYIMYNPLKWEVDRNVIENI